MVSFSSEWPKVFGGDEKLTLALLDRLGERATVITTTGKSYRMRRRATADSPTSAAPEPPSSTDAKAVAPRPKPARTR